jgi:hypothetical protein
MLSYLQPVLDPAINLHQEMMDRDGPGIVRGIFIFEKNFI